ncbi:cystine/glutamate transporter-like isoform X3 [Simochromis diagramma]|uniref:cystine/glutamate transporter-like isoform X3 n=1 Tax=Simochromis diagramma TaxID=43689 RepID=UPI001A7E3490|nr:cystine/glutamate transporter-like isoform X3 [Simochromis diagramma]
MLSPAHILRVVSMQRRCRDKMFLEVASNFKCNISNSSTNITKETNCSVTFATYCVCELPLSAVAVVAVSWKKKKSECEISSHTEMEEDKRERGQERKMGESLQSHGQMGHTQVNKEDDNKKKTDEELVHLRREIGLLPAVSFIMGTVVGSGIFIAPKGVLMNSGSVELSLLVWGLCGVLSLFGALCYAELGTTFTKSGGHFTYLLETLGPLPAFLRLWVEFLFIRPASTSLVSLAFGHYVVEPFFAPCAAPTMLIKLVSILGVIVYLRVSVAFLVAVNCWSVRMASHIQVSLTFIKMFALVLIIIPGIIALIKGKTENFQNGFEFESLTLDRLPLAIYNGLYAYSGWFYLNFVTEEVKNPSRMLFVGAREGYWPQIFSTIHIRRHTPLPALLLMYPLMVIMLISGDISQLISLTSFSHWFFIALATLGMLIHRYRFPLHPRPFKVPLVVAVTFTAVSFFIVGLSLYSDPWNTGCSCVVTLSGVPVYYMTVYHFCLPPTWRRIFNYCSKQLQILLEVAQQEVKTC